MAGGREDGRKKGKKAGGLATLPSVERTENYIFLSHALSYLYVWSSPQECFAQISGVEARREGIVPLEYLFLD